MKKILLFIIVLVSACATPLKLDEILSKSGDVKIETSVSHVITSLEQATLSIVTTQTSSGSLVQYLANSGATAYEIEQLFYSLNLRYGLTNRLELSVNGSGFIKDSRTSFQNSFESNITQGFNRSSIALTWEIAQESEYPALLVGLSTDIANNTVIGDKSEVVSFKDYAIFVSSFFSVDPLLFLFQSSFSFSLEKEIDGKVYQAPKSGIFSPQVYFAINPYSSLNLGILYRHTRKSYYDNKAISNISSNVSFLFGYSFAPDEHSTILFDSQFSNQANYVASTLNIKYIYQF